MYLQSIESARPSRRSTSFIAEAAQRHPILAELKSPEAISDEMGRTCSDFTRRDAVLRAMLLEYQRHGEAARELWSFLLLRTFLPMLYLISGEIRAGSLDQDERESITVLAFLECAERFNPMGTFLAPNLRGKVWQAVFHRVEAENAFENQHPLASMTFLHQELDSRVPVEPGPHLFEGDPDTSIRDMRSLLARWVGDGASKDDLDLVAATLLSGTSIAQFVRERAPRLSASERRQTEDRVRKVLHRATRTVRHCLEQRFERDVAFAGSHPTVG